MAKKSPNRVIVFVLFLGVLMGALDISIVGPAIPSIEHSITIDPQSVGWIFSIYILFNLVGISLFAKLSDYYGRRNIYMVAIAIFTMGSLVVSLSENFTLLIIGRSIQGFGASGIFPVASAVVGDLFAPEKRGRILGMIGAVFGLAFLIGPIIAGTLLHFFEWNSLFLINLPIGVLLFFMSYQVLPNEKSVENKQLDWLGILLMGLMLFSFTWGLSRMKGTRLLESLGSSQTWPYLSLAAILLLLLFFVERKASSPVVRISLFFNRQIRLVALLALVLGLVQASFVFIPDFAVGTFGVDTSQASFMLVPLVLATALGSPIFGRLIDRFGSKPIILVGLALAAGGFYLLQLTNSGKVFFYAGGALIGLGLSILAGSSLRYILLNEVGRADRAITQGMLTIFISVGQLTGAALIGVFVANRTGNSGYLQIFLYQAILLSLVIFPALRLKGKSLEKKVTKV